MKRPGRAVLAASFLSAACYHATIETGAAPSAVVVEKSFASGWIYGLVPPSTVETAGKCSGGVAKVETRLSFVNQLVSFLTFGIYTPMSIKVTCAAGASGNGAAPPVDLTIDENATPVDVAALLDIAVQTSLHERRAVYVRF